MKSMCKKSGGKVKEDNDMAGEEKETKESGAYKKGGHVKKKHGGKVDGKKPAKRADKFARGGAAKKHMKDGGMASKVKSAAGMSATSPLSGAGKTAEPKMPKVDESDD